MKDTLLFSVIIPTYNRAKLLARAINSVIAQQESDWELIIVDDGSTDKTFQVVQKYLRTNKNIRYLRKRNEGPSKARNKGARSAKGKFVTFLDSDDEYMSNHLSLRRKAINQKPSLSFLYGNFKTKGSQYVPDKYDVSRLIHVSKVVSVGTFAIKRDLFLKLKGFKSIYSEDSDLLKRARKIGVKPYKIKTATYIYHNTTPGSVTRKIYKQSKTA